MRSQELACRRSSDPELELYVLGQVRKLTAEATAEPLTGQHPFHHLSHARNPDWSDASPKVQFAQSTPKLRKFLRLKSQPNGDLKLQEGVLNVRDCAGEDPKHVRRGGQHEA